MLKTTCDSCKKENVWTAYYEDLAGGNICRECLNKWFDECEEMDKEEEVLI